MNYDDLTLGFARRATGYKRTDLLFSDIEKLKKVNNKGRIQLIFSGKAHPRDDSGRKLIEQIIGYAQDLKNEIKIVYLSNYDMDLAAKLVSGVDVWLNTPLRPLEASGTSGMKAAHNGVINFGVLDGWWIEGWIEGITGWAIGPQSNESFSVEEDRRRELEDLYNKLENIIVPMFYNSRGEWTKMMKNSIGKIAYYFNTHRVVQRYATEAYL
jgi:starch phosphorylase